MSTALLARLRRLVAPPPQVLADMDAPPSPFVVNVTLYALTACLLLFIAWATLTKLDMVVQARGKLVTAAPTMVVQPLETSVVRDLKVRINDVVRAGDVLALLDPTFVEADSGQLRAKLASFIAQRDRLRAEMDRREFALPANTDEDGIQQKAIFEQRKAEFQARSRSYEEKAGQLRSSLRAKEQDRAMVANRVKILHEIEEMRSTLHQSAIGSRLSLLEAQAQRMNGERDMANISSSILELQHQLDGSEADARAWREGWFSDVGKDLVNVMREISQLEEQLRKADRRHDMVELRAPADAVVLEIAQRSVGSVVREAEALFVLVPLNSSLQAEVLIDPADIAHVKVGDPVVVKLDAFPFQIHGSMAGTVRTLGGNTVSDGSGKGEGAQTQYFRAQVDFDARGLISVPANFQLLPGMLLSADIVGGQRRVITYLLNPILKGLNESLREY